MTRMDLKTMGFALSISAAVTLSAGQTTFKKIHITSSYIGEGPSVADFNKDGKPDLAAGNSWFEGPGFTVKHKFSTGADTYDPGNSYGFNYMALKSQDLNKDGWPDLIFTQGAGYSAVTYYENPKNAAGNWKSVTLETGVVHETAQMADIFKDGKYEFVHTMKVGTGLRIGYSTPSDTTDATKTWTFHPISDPSVTWTNEFEHGLGVGDINSDGRNDIVMQDAWYEQPASVAGYPLWIRHAYDFSMRKAAGGSHMFVSDVDGDGDSDVVGALDGHGWGLAWFENVKGTDGQITFTPHKIMGTRAEEATYGAAFSQLHSLAYFDVDGDGLKDIVSGKRWWAHIHPYNNDPEDSATPVLYWFKCTRGATGTTFKPILIDTASGSGCNLETVDMNGDGVQDIEVSSKAGTNVFLVQRSGSGILAARAPNLRPLFLEVQPDAGQLLIAIRSLQPRAGSGTALVLDSRGKEVVRLRVENRPGQLSDKAFWNGRDAAGKPVGNGTYFFSN
ncbi:MAG: repeat protein [Fibrobacteres bacterium]|nr:repeat protein [Fibrobacterota bacterium]